MAVALEGGLVTPVLRDVAAMSLPQLSANARELATRAQQGRLAAVRRELGEFVLDLRQGRIRQHFLFHGIHHRSISPKTMSWVPMMATMSASM